MGAPILQELLVAAKFAEQTDVSRKRPMQEPAAGRPRASGRANVSFCEIHNDVDNVPMLDCRYTG